MPEQDKHRLSSLALERIRAHGIEPTPAAYEVFFTVVAGTDPMLTRALEDLAPDEVTDETVQRLYDEHIRTRLMQSAFDALGARLQDNVGRVRGLTETAASDQQEFGDAMGLVGAMMGSVNDPKKMAQIIASVVQAAAAMQLRSQSSAGQLKHVEEEVRQLQAEVSAIRRDAETDALTGIGNRRRFDAVLEREFAKARSTRTPLSLVMIDVDHFKRFNDRWGHVTGDAVLRQIANLLQGRLQDRGIVCRYGGEEFVAILPGTRAGTAATLMEQIRIVLAGTAMVRRDTREAIGNITASFGIAELRADDTAETIVERADGYLYGAKEDGRNRLSGDHSGPSIAAIAARVQDSLPRAVNQ